MDQILSINVDNRSATLIEVLEKTAVDNHRPLIIFIQDPPSLNRELIIRSYIQGYNFIPEITSSEDNIKRNNIIMYDTGRVETIGDSHEDSTITSSEVTIDNKLFMLCSIYLRPLTEFERIRRTLDMIKTLSNNCGKSRLILAGDINGTDPLWASPRDVDRRLERHIMNDNGNQHWNTSYERTKALRGRLVSNFLKIMKLTCLNNSELGPTFVSQIVTRRILDITDGEIEVRAHSHIDIFALGEKALRIWKKFELEPITGSQHRLIKIGKIENSRPRALKKRSIYVTKKLNEEHLVAIEQATRNEIRYNWWDIPIDTMKRRIERLTNTIIRFTLAIQGSIKKDISKDKGRTINKLDTGNINIRRRNMLKKLDFLEKRLRVCKDSRRQQVRIPKLEQQIKKLRTSLLFNLKRSTNSSRQSENSDINSLWDTVQGIRDIDSGWRSSSGPTNNRESITSQEEIERIADVKFNKRNVIELNDEYIPNEELIILDYEIETAIYKLRKKMFVGPEGIRFKVFHKLLEFESYRDIIKWWTKMCFKTAYSPRECRITVGKLIPKKAKGQFRIVHLSSPLSAILEQVALARLEYTLEQNLQYNPRQFGFVALRGRTDLVSRILELSIKHQIKNHFSCRTTIISLDIKGAFDNVDQTLLRSKILEQLLPDTSRFWLANFVINRRIRITYKKLTAQERIVTKGVPQGSCLGPILWNFMINRIDAHLTSMPEKLEILAFADDIYMIYNGSDRTLLQEKLNQLIRNITNLKLEVEPSKCQVMVTDFTQNENITDPQLKIYGQTIAATKCLSILGIPITNQLKLDTSDQKFNMQFTRKLEFLNLVKKFDAVNTHLDWCTLIDSYITSIIVINNIPILAIDNKAIEWADKLLTRSMRFIFEWPDNSSVKAIRLITRLRSTRDMTEWAITKSSIKSEFKDSYNLLIRVLKMGGIDNVRRNVIRSPIPTNIRALSLADSPGFKFRDPSHNWHFNKTSDLNQLYRRGPIWLALNTHSTAEMILMFNGLVLEEYRGKHETYPIGHFNMMSMLHKIAARDDVPTRTIVFKESNSLYAALKNSSNHNWRTNELRELLLDYNWIITTIQPQQYEGLLNQLRSRGIIYKRSTEINAETRLFRNSLRPIILKSNWPQVDDYIILSNMKEKARNDIRTEWMNNHTSVTVKISINTACWKTLPPSWISGKRLLMISGLVSDNTGTLTKGTVSPGSIPIGCQESCRYTPANTAHDKWNSEVVFHRAFVCRRYRKERYLIRKTINQAVNEADRNSNQSSVYPWNNQRSLEITLANIRYGQTFLRLLTKVAFENPSCRGRRE